MQLAPVSYRSITMTGGNKVQTQNATSVKNDDVKKEQVNKALLQYSPAVIGLMNGAVWGVIGFVFDRSVSALFKMGNSIKTSVCVNGVIGLAMGINGYIQAKKAQKARNEQQTVNTNNA